MIKSLGRCYDSKERDMYDTEILLSSKILLLRARGPVDRQVSECEMTGLAGVA